MQNYRVLTRSKESIKREKTLCKYKHTHVSVEMTLHVDTRLTDPKKDDQFQPISADDFTRNTALAVAEIKK